jgi:hypothetical protein
MEARAREGTCLEALVRMAMPLCKTAERQCPRTGPGRPPEFPDWQMAVLIMVAVLARRKSKSAQYRFLFERRDRLERCLGMRAFPARSTYFDRYRRVHVLFEQAVLLQGRQAITEGVTHARAVAVDKSLLVARGPAWDQRDRRRGRQRRGVDREADWGYSEHHGWVYGYSYEVLVSADLPHVVLPLMVSVGTASCSEQRSFGSKIHRLPKQTRYVLADAAYDSNAYGEAIEYDDHHRTTGRRLVCPLISRAGHPSVGHLPHRGRRERLRQQRGTRLAFFQSPAGKRLYQRRRQTVEPFNEWFKSKFDLRDRVWHRGLCNNATQVTASIFAYQLLVRYHHRRGGNNGSIKWILDII